MWDCEHLQTVDSTQKEALRRIGGAPSAKPFAIWTGCQTEGQARHGRVWLASAKALAISVAWPQSPESLSSEPWPLRISLAVIEALCGRWSDLDKKLGVKWPNDIIYKGAKLGGVLVARHRAAQQTWLIAGVGLNIAGEQSLPSELKAASLDAAGITTVSAQALADLVCAAVAAEAQRSDAEISKRFDSRNVHAQQIVELHDSNNGQIIMSGMVLGVTELGAIRLKQDNGRTVQAQMGEISLRSVRSIA